MDSDINAQNYQFFIAQTQKNRILQVAVSEQDTCDQNGKPLTPLSSMSSTHYHYFHTLRTPSEDFTGCTILLFESVGSRDIILNLRIDLYFTKLYIK